jgi:hypothetical protein
VSRAHPFLEPPGHAALGEAQSQRFVDRAATMVEKLPERTLEPRCQVGRQRVALPDALGDLAQVLDDDQHGFLPASPPADMNERLFIIYHGHTASSGGTRRWHSGAAGLPASAARQPLRFARPGPHARLRAHQGNHDARHP